MAHREPGAHRPFALRRGDALREPGHRRAQRRPGALLGGPLAHRPYQLPDLLLLAVQQSVLLAREVVGERSAGDPGRVGHRLHRQLVEAVLDGQPQGRFVHGLPGGFLLAFPQSHSALHAIHYPRPERPDGAGPACASAVDVS